MSNSIYIADSCLLLACESYSNCRMLTVLTMYERLPMTAADKVYS